MCTSPNYMIFAGKRTVEGKPKFDFLGHHEYNRLLELGIEAPFIQVPCGKCLECRIQYARTWADRCVLEAKQYKNNYFVTLTYDDNHLPENGSLRPEDMKNFMKRLRYRFKGVKVRFLGCGEYGDLSLRPHYHLILFNLPLSDLDYTFFQEVDGKMVKYNRPPSKNNDLYFSQTIYDCWIETDKDRAEAFGHHLGQISVGLFSYDTAAYVAQYVTKKCNPNNAKLYDQLGLYPEFLRMSNRPGIAAQYFEDNPLVHYNGKMVIPCDGEAHLSSVPRYFDKLFKKKYGDDVFSEINYYRYKKRIRGRETYLNGKHDFDIQAQVREHNIKKIHHLKKTF